MIYCKNNTVSEVEWKERERRNTEGWRELEMHDKKMWRQEHKLRRRGQ